MKSRILLAWIVCVCVFMSTMGVYGQNTNEYFEEKNGREQGFVTQRVSGEQFENFGSAGDIPILYGSLAGPSLPFIYTYYAGRNAAYQRITFSQNSFIQNGDVVTVYDANKDACLIATYDMCYINGVQTGGAYTGNSLSGRSIVMPSGFFSIEISTTKAVGQSATAVEISDLEAAFMQNAPDIYIKDFSFYKQLPGGNLEKMDSKNGFGEETQAHLALFLGSNENEDMLLSALVVCYDQNNRMLFNLPVQKVVTGNHDPNIADLQDTNVILREIDLPDAQSNYYFKIMLWSSVGAQIPVTANNYYFAKKSSSLLFEGVLLATSKVNPENETLEANEIAVLKPNPMTGLNEKVIMKVKGSGFDDFVGHRCSFLSLGGAIIGLSKNNAAEVSQTEGLSESSINALLEDNCYVIMNGIRITTGITDEILQRTQSVTLIDHDGNGKYDAVKFDLVNFVNINKNYMTFTAESFRNQRGTWNINNSPFSTFTNYLPTYMSGRVNGSASTNPATTKIYVPKDGVYKIFVHTADYEDATKRQFEVQVGDAAVTVGSHKKLGWHWDYAEVALFEGEYDLKMNDTKGSFVRFEMLVITDDLDFSPLNTETEIKALAGKSYVFKALETNQEGRPGDEYAVKVNGEYVIFDTAPEMVGETLMIPYNSLAQYLNYEPIWDQTYNTITLTKDQNYLDMSVNEKVAYVNDIATVLYERIYISGGKPMIPLHSLCDYLGVETKWESQSKTMRVLLMEDKYQRILLRPTSFEQLGCWSIQKESSQPAFENTFLIGRAGSAIPAAPATATIYAKETGEYKLWVRSRDYPDYNQGVRRFRVGINGQLVTGIFGIHGFEGFRWATAGNVVLQKGENIVSLHDTSANYARCDAVFLTNDLNLAPSENYNTLLSYALPVQNHYFFNSVFPFYALSDVSVVKEASIESEFTKVVFYQVLENEKSFVQNEIYVKDFGQWIKVKDRTDEHGYLMLKAISSNKGGWTDGYMTFKPTVEYGGKIVSATTSNIYKAGVPVWLIPSDFEKLSDSKVALRFEDRDDADVSVVWEFDQREQDPKVTLDATFNEDGAYSFGLFTGKEHGNSEYENALAPFRIMEKRVPIEPFVFFEHYLFTPMGTVTIPENNNIVPGRKLTSGVVVDPEWIPRGYVYRETSKFGVSMRGPAGGVRGNLFAPLFGSDYCNFKAGESYNISYRVVNKLDSWFETYKHISQNIFDVYDYRSNYYTSLNEAIYNTTDLMMNDDYGGWDPVDKAHYNMEEQDLTSVANPMTAVQRYLLTENDDILRERAIPTLASLLTRIRLHFKRFNSTGGADYISDPKPTTMGEPIKGYNLNVYGGLYEMSRGMMPDMLGIGYEKAGTVTNSYGSIPPFVNDLSLYRYTNNISYLNSAKAKADQYLADVVYGAAYNSNLPGFSSFINISYFPNLASLIDIYEVTGEQRYLDAAIKAGQMLSTTVWVPGIDGDKGETSYYVDPQATLARPYMQGHQFWWHGSIQWRLGNDRGEAKPPSEGNYPLQAETVPGWLPARVGLGLEQASTFAEALNIYMSSWVGDLIKLSVYSGDEYFETVAKNAIIGRFGNYPGYYQNRYITHQSKAEYPYQGPDLTSIYWHHIPPFLAMLEDFLINQIWAKSQTNIEFPSVRQQGYAYFNSNQYGFEAGRFYNEEDMWLWLDRGIIEPDSVQINYLTAKKDGVLGMALMNEAETATTTTITLGGKISGGADYSGTGTIYEPDGTTSQITVTNGSFTIQIPSKGLRSVVLNIPTVSAPGFASVPYSVVNNNPQQNVATHNRGKAYVLQLSLDKYFAYIYVTDLPANTKQMKVTYTIGTQPGEIIALEYPFEVIIEVNDSSKDLTYNIEITKADNSKEHISGNTIGSLR